MPIIDPSLFFSLTKNEIHPNESNSRNFYVKYLQIASKNIYRNFTTAYSHIRFKNDASNFIEIINRKFKTNIPLDKYDESMINYYEIIYKCLNKDTCTNNQIDGLYYSISSYNKTLRFFLPNMINNDCYFWLLSDSSNAILIINDIHDDDDKINFLQFEIDLMIGAGFLIILCLNYRIDEDWDDYIEEDNNLLKNHILLHNRFAEIHICAYDTRQLDFFLDLLINTDISKYNFVYFYSNYENLAQEKYKKQVERLKENPRITLIQFNGSPYDAFRYFELKPIEKFNYCQTGFENDRVKIILYGIPLYEKSDYKDELFTFQFVKDYSIGYVSKENFFFTKKSRIPVFLEQNVKKYVTFRDIHNINKSFYANVPLYLSNVDGSSFLLLKSIISYSKNHNNEKMKVKQKHWWNSKCKFLSSIVSNYKVFFEQKKKKKFDFHHNQIYVISEIYNFIANRDQSSTSNGVVFEIPTGEGKTSIITMAAVTLAKQKKIVHIVTSNIVLANRDYNDSFSFFKNQDLKSTILLHKNELPHKSDLQTDNYPSEFFSDEIFENSLAMNFDACNITNKNVNIIYSTLTNFETLYLHMMQNCQGIIDKYYENCVLLIDEADSILIDELTNGTILSRPMKTNAKKILTSVYRAHIQKNKNEEELVAEIKEKYSECTDINTKDIKRMFEEIDIVQNDKEFNDGLKYLIVKSGTRREIIPFDFDHTGLLEPNKEFNGFIHQFVAIKEREKNIRNSDINIRDVSMNYLYISHPIYIKLYKNVFGLTGTIGDAADRSIINSIYYLNTRIIPKEHPNIYYEYPISFTNSIDERNELIVNEIMEYHKNGYPVLAIFLSPKEIDTIKSKIESHAIYLKYKVDIGVYGGQGNKPNEKAGKEGSITLGTNICGRGTNIEIEDKPLHVIVSYNISNPRLLIQAYGRTARKNNFGTVHTICSKNDFFSVKKEISKEDNNYLNFFHEINKMQNEFIEYFRSKRNWIFDPKLDSVKLSTNDINMMRMAKINVNRSNAYNCIYPICMKVPTFLNIQAQKIFSLFNCPECKYTWRLFQQYIREMILQSWSIFITRLERKFYESGYNQNLFDKKKNKLLNELSRYLPESKEKLDIVPTFLHIYNMIANNYKQILYFFGSFLPSDIVEEVQGVKKISRISLEFRPYSLKYESSHKIKCLSDSRTNIDYINDPELSYIKTGSPFISITNRIDNIFNEICNVFNNFISDKINFKFFLRRTLGGCEFGLCLDCDFEIDLDFLEEMNLQNKNSKYYFGFKNNCLIDTSPLFVFTIFVKSQAPLIAGLFMFLLLYLSNLIKNILFASCEIYKLLKGNIKILIKSIAQAFLSKAFGDVVDQVSDKLCEYMQNIILEQISCFKNSLPKYYNLMYLLTYLFVSKVPDISEKIGEEFKGKFGDKIFKAFKKKHAEYASNGFDHLFKIGFLLVLCAASFLLNFHKNKSIKFQTDDVAKQFTEDNRTDTISKYVTQNQKLVDNSISAYGKSIKQEDKIDISEFAQQLLQDMMQNVKP